MPAAAAPQTYRVQGSDLALTRYAGAPSAAPLASADSWGSLDLQVVAGGAGGLRLPGPVQDLGAVAGRENLAQALTLRLLTAQGALEALGHPDYGSRLVSLIGRSNDQATRNLARLYVIQTVRQEPRLQALTALSVTPVPGQPDTLQIALTVKPMNDANPLSLTVDVTLSSFVDRTYPDIVRDVLTTLTQGVVAEKHTVAYDPIARPLVIPDIVLTRRPVRRVSMVSGFVAATTAGDPPVATQFSLNDYRLVPNPDDPGDISRIRFMPLAKRKPAPNTEVTVNYYPRTTDPTPLTDLNVGSVVRTIVEAMSRELAALYAQLNIAYDSGFLDTATGASLDRVVALLSYARRRAGRAVGSVTFTRRAGSIGSVTIPAGTPVTDSADKIRYVTSERYDMQAGESTAEVRVQGAADVTPVVDAGVLTVIQRAIAGLDSVTNARPTARATDDENDEALRARVRDALLAANKGTRQAIRDGLLALPGVRDATVEEMPNGVPGEIRVTVSLAQQPPGGNLPQEVLDRIEELRPAGIRVLRAQAGQIALAANVTLVLAGSSLAPAEVESVHQAVRDRLVAEIGRKGVGERIRTKPLVAVLLSDARIADATLAIGAKGAPAPQPSKDFQLDNGSSASLDPADIAFGPDSFATPPSAAGQPVNVEVRAVVGATPLAGVTIDAMKAELTARLTSYLAALAPGGSVDSASVLLALANDAKYGIDPLKLSVTLTAEDQFAQIAQGGQAFTVKPGQTFALVSLDLAA